MSSVHSSTVGFVREWRIEGLWRLYPERPRITVGLGTCGKAAGGEEVYAAIADYLQEQGVDAVLEAVGCRGACWAEPLVEVQNPGCGRALYGNVSAGEVGKLMDSIVCSKPYAKKLIGYQYRDDFPLLAENSGIALFEGDIEQLPFFGIQDRRVSGKCGHVHPVSVEEYAAYGGYAALSKALDSLTPDQVVDEVAASGLRGRGGAGYPTGQKWRAVSTADSEAKYVIANADEGDPGAFMDRNIMEGDPHALIEGMALAGYAVGARQGYVFTRAEYPLATRTLKDAIEEARAHGILGEHVLGSDFCFDMRVVESAGAYVCGEATALIRALEGFPPRPKSRPPHLSERGLWGKPTCLNNVETLANVPLVVMRGADWFREIGTAASPGTKLFSVAGCVDKTGLLEVPMGISVDDIVAASSDDGVGADVRACQVGGPSGVLLPRENTWSLDFEGLESAGGSIGSGGLIFLGVRDCVVETVRYLTEFSRRESCGQCRSCREGLGQCSDMLQAFVEGCATDSVLDELCTCAKELETGSRCGLGRMAARPILSSLRFFEDEYRAHIQGECPGMVCKSLIEFSVVPEKCPGCRCCKPTCPTNAMQGRFGKPYSIDKRLCIRCWMCTATCPYDAIRVHART